MNSEREPQKKKKKKKKSSFLLTEDLTMLFYVKGHYNLFPATISDCKIVFTLFLQSEILKRIMTTG